MALAAEKFAEVDTSNSQTLHGVELVAYADWMIVTFHPSGAAAMDEEARRTMARGVLDVAGRSRGELSFAQIAKWYFHVSAVASAQVSATELVSQIFDLVDSDGSGFLDREEAKVFLASTGCGTEQLDYYCQDLWRTTEQDENGQIGREQFILYMLRDEDVTADGHLLDKAREAELHEQKKRLLLIGAGWPRRLASPRATGHGR